MPFNEDYQNVMNTIRETGSTAAEVYAEKNTESAANNENTGGKSSVDWGKLVNSFAGAAQSYLDNRETGRKWNDFKVNATIDEGTQKTIIIVVCILAGALVFFGLMNNKKHK
ncbi:MAG: hypothetical protein J6Y35_03895 [Bacteroidales bacterium]|nr:hypothetical protein [Bacteroidales bacterium]